MGAKSDFPWPLAAAAGVKSTAPSVPTSVLNWRRERGWEQTFSGGNLTGRRHWLHGRRNGSSLLNGETALWRHGHRRPDMGHDNLTSIVDRSKESNSFATARRPLFPFPKSVRSNVTNVVERVRIR